MDESASKKLKHADEEKPTNNSAILSMPVSNQILNIQLMLSYQLSSLTFSDPVTTVYNPVQHAQVLYRQYIERFCNTTKEVLILGMNPGPWGMAQTGVPFGEISIVKDWLQLRGEIVRPENEHPQRPITGLACTRSEISGKKLWQLIRKLSSFETSPEIVLANIFLHNFCPLLFLKASGCNITPVELKIVDRRELFRLCDEALRATIHVLQCKVILCIGKFAQSRAYAALKHFAHNIKIYSIPHPSPRNVSGRKNWEQMAISRIHELGLETYFTPKAQ